MPNRPVSAPPNGVGSCALSGPLHELELIKGGWLNAGSSGQSSRGQEPRCFAVKAIPSLNKMMVLEAGRCQWMERRESVTCPWTCRNRQNPVIRAWARRRTPRPGWMERFARGGSCRSFTTMVAWWRGSCPDVPQLHPAVQRNVVRDQGSVGRPGKGNDKGKVEGRSAQRSMPRFADWDQSSANAARGRVISYGDTRPALAHGWKLIWPPCRIYRLLPLKPVICAAAKSHQHPWPGIAAMITQCLSPTDIVRSGSKALSTASSSVAQQR